MKNIIIDGANGYIGSRFTEHLSLKGYNIIALVDPRFNYDFIKELPNVECIEFALQELEHVHLIGQKRYDVLYHFAWEGVNAKLRNEPDVQIRNIEYALKVIKFCEKYKIKKLIIPGSAAEVSCGGKEINGNDMPAPSDVYSAVKVAVRYISQTYSLQHGIELVWPLITSIYGPGRDDNNLISYTIKSLLRGEKPSFTGLEQRWDYLYIDDLLCALELLGLYGKGGKVYPVASGVNHKMYEYVEIIRELINPSLPLGIGELTYKNPDKIDNQFFDISSLINDTGFCPKVSFQEGIKKTIDYFRSLHK